MMSLCVETNVLVIIYHSARMRFSSYEFGRQLQILFTTSYTFFYLVKTCAWASAINKLGGRVLFGSLF